MTILKNLQWRRAIKGFTPRTSTSSHNDQSENILEAIRLAPSSFGLQPYIIYNIKSHDILKELSPGHITFDNGEKIRNSSNLLAFGARNDAKNPGGRMSLASNAVGGSARRSNPAPPRGARL